jgi:hypothetical protein
MYSVSSRRPLASFAACAEASRALGADEGFFLAGRFLEEPGAPPSSSEEAGEEEADEAAEAAAGFGLGAEERVRGGGGRATRGAGEAGAGEERGSPARPLLGALVGGI